jgi:hypothetical protein
VDAFNSAIKNTNNYTYYFIAITPVTPREMSDTDFQSKIERLKLMPSDTTHSCYWGDVEDYFKKIHAAKVLDVFKFNTGQIYQTCPETDAIQK